MGCCLSCLRWICGIDTPKEDTKQYTNINDEMRPKKRKMTGEDSKHNTRYAATTRSQNSDNTALQDELTHYKQKAGEFNASKEKAEQDNSVLRGHLSKLQAENKTLQTQLKGREKAEKEISVLKGHLSKLQDENKTLQTQLKGKEAAERENSDLRTHVSKLQDECNNLLGQLKQAEDAIKKKDKDLVKKGKELVTLKQQNETLLTRLSTLAGAQLTNNNPNIANLSDVNRPTKLAEQYAELYDNDWTDAISELESGGGIPERQGLDILRDMLVEIYRLSETKAETQMRSLVDTMGQFTKNHTLPTEMMKYLKETRKENFKDFLPDLGQEMQKKLQHSPAVLNSTKVFQDKCLELCWLMRIQDPPVVMDTEVNIQGRPFEKMKYKEYTATGSHVEYVVWPPLYLHQGGSLLCKGTAQAQDGSQAKQHKRASAGAPLSSSHKSVIKVNSNT